MPKFTVWLPSQLYKRLVDDMRELQKELETTIALGKVIRKRIEDSYEHTDTLPVGRRSDWTSKRKGFQE